MTIEQHTHQQQPHQLEQIPVQTVEAKVALKLYRQMFKTTPRFKSAVYDRMFGRLTGNDPNNPRRSAGQRVYFTLNGNKVPNVVVPKLVVDAVTACSRPGYEYYVDNYIAGIVAFEQQSKRPDGTSGMVIRTISLAKLLTKNQTQLEQLGLGEALQTFVKDPVRANALQTDNQFMAVLSRHPYDIAGISTGRSWKNCTNLLSGVKRDDVKNYIKYGFLALYLISTKENIVFERFAATYAVKKKKFDDKESTRIAALKAKYEAQQQQIKEGKKVKGTLLTEKDLIPRSLDLWSMARGSLAPSGILHPRSIDPIARPSARILIKTYWPKAAADSDSVFSPNSDVPFFLRPGRPYGRNDPRFSDLAQRICNLFNRRIPDGDYHQIKNVYYDGDASEVVHDRSKNRFIPENYIYLLENDKMSAKQVSILLDDLLPLHADTTFNLNSDRLEVLAAIFKHVSKGILVDLGAYNRLASRLPDVIEYLNNHPIASAEDTLYSSFGIGLNYVYPEFDLNIVKFVLALYEKGSINLFSAPLDTLLNYFKYLSNRPMDAEAARYAAEYLVISQNLDTPNQLAYLNKSDVNHFLWLISDPALIIQLLSDETGKRSSPHSSNRLDATGHFAKFLSVLYPHLVDPNSDLQKTARNFFFQAFQKQRLKFDERSPLKSQHRDATLYLIAYRAFERQESGNDPYNLNVLASIYARYSGESDLKWLVTIVNGESVPKEPSSNTNIKWNSIDKEEIIAFASEVLKDIPSRLLLTLNDYKTVWPFVCNHINKPPSYERRNYIFPSDAKFRRQLFSNPAFLDAMVKSIHENKVNVANLIFHLSLHSGLRPAMKHLSFKQAIMAWLQGLKQELLDDLQTRKQLIRRKNKSKLDQTEPRISEIDNNIRNRISQAFVLLSRQQQRKLLSINSLPGFKPKDLADWEAIRSLWEPKTTNELVAPDIGLGQLSNQNVRYTKEELVDILNTLDNHFRHIKYATPLEHQDLSETDKLKVQKLELYQMEYIKTLQSLQKHVSKDLWTSVNDNVFLLASFTPKILLTLTDYSFVQKLVNSRDNWSLPELDIMLTRMLRQPSKYKMNPVHIRQSVEEAVSSYAKLNIKSLDLEYKLGQLIDKHLNGAPIIHDHARTSSINKIELEDTEDLVSPLKLKTLLLDSSIGSQQNLVRKFWLLYRLRRAPIKTIESLAPNKHILFWSRLPHAYDSTTTVNVEDLWAEPKASEDKATVEAGHQVLFNSLVTRAITHSGAIVQASEKVTAQLAESVYLMSSGKAPTPTALVAQGSPVLRDERFWIHAILNNLDSSTGIFGLTLIDSSEDWRLLALLYCLQLTTPNYSSNRGSFESRNGAKNDVAYMIARNCLDILIDNYNSVTSKVQSIEVLKVLLTGLQSIRPDDLVFKQVVIEFHAYAVVKAARPTTTAATMITPYWAVRAYAVEDMIDVSALITSILVQVSNYATETIMNSVGREALEKDKSKLPLLPFKTFLAQLEPKWHHYLTLELLLDTDLSAYQFEDIKLNKITGNRTWLGYSPGFTTMSHAFFLQFQSHLEAAADKWIEASKSWSMEERLDIVDKVNSRLISFQHLRDDLIPLWPTLAAYTQIGQRLPLVKAKALEPLCIYVSKDKLGSVYEDTLVYLRSPFVIFAIYPLMTDSDLDEMAFKYNRPIGPFLQTGNIRYLDHLKKQTLDHALNLHTIEFILKGLTVPAINKETLNSFFTNLLEPTGTLPHTNNTEETADDEK